MGTRSPDEVKAELETERERLGNAVQTLRLQAGAVRRRLPLIALGATATGLALRTAKKRIFRRS
jgi:hypothetical protein